MQNDIRTKLAAELSQPITSERQVVYILVEMRKLMELNGDDDSFWSLKFHCDWTAHSELRGPAAQEIVRLFDKYQGMFDQMDALSPGEAQPFDDSFMPQLGLIMTLSNFRNELSQYLGSQGMDASVPFDDGWWPGFLRHYASVIEDCPLKCVSQGLKHTDEVTLRAQELRPDTKAATGFTLYVEWSWTAKRDGTVYSNRQFY